MRVRKGKTIVKNDVFELHGRNRRSQGLLTVRMYEVVQVLDYASTSRYLY